MDNKIFYFSIIFIIGLIFFLQWFGSYRERQKRKYYVKKYFGKREGKKADMKEVSSFYHTFYHDGLDPITWNDLHMDEIFHRFDRCRSYIGRLGLYSLLRRPLKTKEGIEKRQEELKKLRKHKDEGITIQSIYTRLGEKSVKDFAKLLDKGMDSLDSKWKIYLPLCSLFPLYIIIFLLIFGVQGISVLFILGFSILNQRLSSQLEKEAYGRIDTMGQVSRIIDTSKRLKPKEGDLFYEERMVLYEKTKDLKSLARSSGIVRSAGMGSEYAMFVQFLDILFLIQGWTLKRFISEFNHKKETIKELTELLGEIEGKIVLASLWETEDLVEGQVAEKGIFLEQGIHPLLEEPVPNSLTLKDKGILLTGSNASGKSTYLRMIGINVHLFQTIGSMYGKSYCGEVVDLQSAIDISDDLLNKDSYFVAEGKAIGRMLLPSPRKKFLLLDEIFRGTNTIDRISAATMTLKALSKENFVIAATHDGELTVTVKDVMDNYHFDEKIKEGQLLFDYTLKPGPARSKNAIKILELLDYPKEVIQGAEKLAEKMESRRMDEDIFSTSR
ncbi:MAG: hypothetical protein Q4Q07_00625 [Tissierellia bacterium]|nr:hypothetical protein [Tissierellia bacterium]